jgi:outer membrane protein assembly factor BamB
VRTGTIAVKNAIGGGAVYGEAAFGSRLVAVDMATHRVRWSYDAHSVRLITPSYAGGVVYLASIGQYGSVLHALDAGTGRQKWQFRVPRHVPGRRSRSARMTSTSARSVARRLWQCGGRTGRD